MNLVFLIGRLTKDPTIRTTDSDMKVARYTLAVDRRFAKKDGEGQTADFINCIVFGKGADFADNYLRQGTKIAIRGRLQTGSYTNKDGQKVYTTDVIVDEHEFAGAKSDGASQPKAATPSPDQAEAKPDTSFIEVPEGVEESLPW